MSETDLDLIKNVCKTYIDNIIMPLAIEGNLDSEIAKDAILVYIEELKKEDEPEVIIITANNEYQLLHPYSNITFIVDGKEWKSIEHYFQASRFFGTDDTFAESIRTTSSATIARRKSTNAGANQKSRPNWEKIKRVELKNAYLALLRDNPEIMELLKKTGKAKLIFQHKTDTFYGMQNESGKGNNEIGKILTEIRDN